MTQHLTAPEHERRRTPARSRALAELGLLRTVPAPELRRLARIAATLARQPHGAPAAAVHLFDDAYQHRVAASPGVPLQRTPAPDSMCVRVVNDQQAVYCQDATREPRFDGNPFTTGPEPVRLYYSTPLRTSDGTLLGTLCVFSPDAGELDAEQRACLDDLGDQAGAYLELTGLTDELRHLAAHDPLTGLANRLLLSHRLDAAMADPARRPHEPALLLVDLDRFKVVNDKLGHAAGDDVLVGTAARLRECVREGDLVARLGGDEFAVLLDDLPDPDLLDAVADRVVAACLQPYDTSAGAVLCGVSVGRALGQAGDLAYELVGRADADMYVRKALGSQRTGDAPRG